MAGGTVTLMARGAALGAVDYQWQFNTTNILGATNSILTITNVQSVSQGSYRVIVSSAGGSTTSSSSILNVLPLSPPRVTGWTSPANQWANSQNNLVLGLTVQDPPNAPASTCQWQFNGTNLNADLSSPNTYEIFSIGAGQEGTYSATVSNASGSRSFTWKVHAAFPGGVALWGADDFGQADRPAAAMSGVIAIAGGVSNSIALMANGTVTQWGCNWGNVPANLTNAVAVSSGFSHTLALRSDGTVVSWGLASDQANLVPTNLAGVKAIAAGWNHNLALLSNSTVTAWGMDAAVLGWHLTEVPPGLSNVTAISAGSLHSLALRSNGTVVAWGYSPQGETNVPPGLSNVVAIAAGGEHSLALKSDGNSWSAWGFDGSGQCDVPSGLSNVIAVAAGWAHSIALKNDGTVVAWGDDSAGQTDVATNLVNVKSIAAGGHHSLAAMFSPTLQYPLDASKDLLLVYNTNSMNSGTVLNYYLQNRPLAATANVLGLGCTNAEIILPSDFTNEINAPLAQWLAANPTKRPRYVVLFLDVPSRVDDPNNNIVQPSVSYQIATGTASWQPLVTHLNMGDTNACIAYINKLALMGSNFSPGQLVISAGGAAGYGNANYVIDNIRHGTGFADDYTSDWWFGLMATNGLAQSAVPSAAVLYTNGIETFTNGIASNLPHITNAANVAGYMSWGGHSSLGSAYATSGELQWSGHSSWFLIATMESFNGDINVSGDGMGNFIEWFSPNAFGGTNYLNTPVGAVTHVEEPTISGIENMQAYYGLWAAGQNFATCAWAARATPYYMAVGDPLVRR